MQPTPVRRDDPSRALLALLAAIIVIALAWWLLMGNRSGPDQTQVTVPPLASPAITLPAAESVAPLPTMEVTAAPIGS